MNEFAPFGWAKAMRSDDALELIRSNPLTYVLAAVIAMRARWKVGFNQHGLGLGEAMLGDYREYGMTEQQYRTAKNQLERWGFATFKATNRGTIATLTDTRLFSVSNPFDNEPANTQPTTPPRTSSGQATCRQRLTRRKDCKK